MHITLHKNGKSVVVTVNGGTCPRVGETVNAHIQENVGYDFHPEYKSHRINGVVSSVVHQYSTSLGDDMQFINVYLK